MDVTSDEIRSSRFQGTRHVYDRREVDAFLHRAAATLELYERKLAVTESHVQSLEKALDLANSRVRSVRERDVRIGQLETALASAQHHYELEVERAEVNTIPVLPAGEPDADALEESRRRSAELVDEARQEAEEIRTGAVDYTEQASAEADEIVAAAHAEATGLIDEARVQEATMLKELATVRSEAEAALEAEIVAKRTALDDELAGNSERIAGMEAEEIRTGAVDYTEQASAEADEIVAAAHAEAAGLIDDAKVQEAAMLKELAAIRSEAEVALETEIVAKRTALDDELAGNSERLAGMEAVAMAEMDAKLQKAEQRAAKVASKSQQIIQQTEERAKAAEAERNELAAELAQTAAEAEDSRNAMMADVEVMVSEAVSQAEVDRDLMLLEAQVRLETAEGEREALIELARVESAEMTAAAEEKLEALRRQAAQMRTALSDLHERFTDVGSLTAEDFELATALVDLDLRDVGEVVDLTVEEEAIEQLPAEAAAVVPLKSKWAQPANVAPRGLAIEVDTAEADVQQEDQEAATNGEHHPTWRDKVEPQRSPAEVPEEEVKESLGFYERRLAGLRARLQEAMPDEY